MAKASLIFQAMIFLAITFVALSCEKDEDPSTNCSIEVLYKGTAVCNQGDDAAAISFTSAPNEFLILKNFFEFIEEANIELDDAIKIEYENIDSSLVNSGILCGPLIVAPVADLTCFEKL